MTRQRIDIDLFVNARNLVNGLTGAGNQVRRFGRGVTDNLNGIGGNLKGIGSNLGRIQAQLVGLGLGVGAVAGVTGLVVQSARLDKRLIQLRQTAGVTGDDIKSLRGEVFGLATATGQNVDDLVGGFGNFVAAGLGWQDARLAISAVNDAMAVTGSTADTLASALSVAAEAFNFDLAKPGLAVDLLDKMTVAGRLGNAELEDLGGVFSRIGVNAKAAGFDIAETLAFTEQLSLIEKQPERLATLADSTLRIFTNQKYKDEAASATGVDFYETKGPNKGQARPNFDVLDDIAAKYRQLKTDAQRDNFIGEAFGKADLDTIKGLRALFSGDNLEGVRKLVTTINGASGTIAKDLPDAIHNSVDQVGRLKATLRNAADDFAQPLNEALTELIDFSLKPKDQGGLGLDGKDILLGGAGIIAAGATAAHFLPKALEGLAGKPAELLGGVVTGQLLKDAADVLSVYVVNMPSEFCCGDGGGGGGDAESVVDDLVDAGVAVAGGALAQRVAANWQTLLRTGRTGLALLTGLGSLGEIGALGAGASATAGGLALGAGAAGYGVGSLIYNFGLEGTGFADSLGKAINSTLAFAGNDDAQEVRRLGQEQERRDASPDYTPLSRLPTAAGDLALPYLPAAAAAPAQSLLFEQKPGLSSDDRRFLDGLRRDAQLPAAVGNVRVPFLPAAPASALPRSLAFDPNSKLQFLDLTNALKQSLTNYGDQAANAAVRAIEGASFKGNIHIKIDSEGRPAVREARTSNQNVKLDLDVGRTMVTP